jgi:uncharacterized phage protein gp47/JayE
MQLQLLNNASLLNVMMSATQTACSQLVNTATGSVLRAIMQANAAVALWIQWLSAQILLTTRAATSNGADLDSWVADYGLARLPAVAASGTVTLLRNSTINIVLVAPGGAVRTGDGTVSFAIGIDAGNAAWNIAANAYAFSIGQGSITVPIVALTSGAAGNVQPGTISLIASSMPGVDSVTNASATTGGLDAESDAALRVRASRYFASLSKATTVAITGAVTAIQQGLTVLVLENTPASGQLIVVVDDGTGNPPASLLQAAYGAVDAVRPVGTVFTVQPPAVESVAITAVLTTASGANHAAIVGQVSTAITAMVDSLPIGATLPITRVAAVAYNISANVLNVAVSLNNAGNDIVPGSNMVVRVSSVVVS